MWRKISQTSGMVRGYILIDVGRNYLDHYYISERNLIEFVVV